MAQENATGMQPGELNADTIRKQALADERKRVADIRAALAAANLTGEAYAEFSASLTDHHVTVDKARELIINKLAAQSAETRTQSQSGATITRDAQETLALGVENALLRRINPAVELKEGRQFAYMSLLEMGRAFAESKTGKQLRGMGKAELAGLLLQPSMGGSFQQFAVGYAGTTDFPNILANVFNKSLRMGYNAEPQTFKPWTKPGTAPDFKDMNRVQLGDVPTLQQISANGEIRYLSVGDAKEKYALATYANIVAINRQTLINDDLSALQRLPESMGRSAARMESDVVYAILLANAAMGVDSIALFDANTHLNYTSSGTAISVASLGVGRQKLRLQKGLNSVGYLNLAPRFLLVPPELETIAQQFTVQTNIIYTKSADFNPFANSLQVVPEPRLSGGVGSNSGSAVSWYLVAEPGMIDTIEYAHLEGQEGVYMETRMGFDVDGMELKAREDFAAKALDWRGMYKNAGA